MIVDRRETTFYFRRDQSADRVEQQPKVDEIKTISSIIILFRRRVGNALREPTVSRCDHNVAEQS